MEAKNVVISTVLGLLILAGGVGLGILYQTQIAGPAVVQPSVTTNTPIVPQALRDLGSKLIPSISANGTVTKIDGSNITLVKEGDSMTISVRDDAKIYSNSIVAGSPATKGAPTSVSKEITFKDIKVGDNVSITIRVIGTTGKIEGLFVIVLPSAPVPTPAPTPVLPVVR